MPQQRPSPVPAPIRPDATDARPRRRGRAAFGLALAGGLLADGTVLASPALEYGPEAEARFLEVCASSPSSAGSSACRCVMERMQEELGYAGFLAAASGGRAAYAANGAAGQRPAQAPALRRAETACAARAARLTAGAPR
jgi:hypothetical protein